MKEIIIKNSISEILIDSNMSYYMFSFYFILFLENEDKVKILEQIALNRNCKMKGNELDYEKASKIVLEEFRNGKLGKISLETPEEGTKEA